jgi:two-component sensor histidine kinase
VLGPYRGEGEPRYTLAGEHDIRIGPRAAVALVMALHELATNAAKYGALSNTQGRVNVAWTVADGQAPPSLRLQWREIGGPAVKPPDRQGFGSRLIRGLSKDASAQADLAFEPTGLVCTIELPLPSGTES